VFVGTHRERDHWLPIYQRVVKQEAQWRADSTRWQASSNEYQQENSRHLAELADLQTKVAASVGDLDHPRFVLWNSCGAGGPAAGCPLIPGHEYIGGVPDTFTYFVNFHSTVPVTLWIMSASNFVCWETHNCAWRAVGWQDRRELTNGVFHEAEGCAGYFAVFFSNQYGTLFPDVRVTRKPASQSTGACS
jgi:hypothetical protein